MSQHELFGHPQDTALPTVLPAPVAEDLQALRAHLSDRLHLGTSSWSFPGWSGIVYDRQYPSALLSKAGLKAYAQHPLLNAVGLDSSFYQPPTADKLLTWKEQVPTDFRFLVKGARQITTPWQGDARGRPRGINPHFLSPSFALTHMLEPVLEGLGSQLGTLLWQFPPLGPQITANPRRFAEDLYRFLKVLPTGPSYSVELRDSALLTEDFYQALYHGGAVPALAVHPRLPEIGAQRRGIGTPQTGPLIIRWMLRRDRAYQAAKKDFSPFDRLQATDSNSRNVILEACREALAADRDVYPIANNKAEGSSPLSLFDIARNLVTF